jgi:hypothetical protein
MAYHPGRAILSVRELEIPDGLVAPGASRKGMLWTAAIVAEARAKMDDDAEFSSLTETLELLPPATPFFVPDELLVLWFPPWLGADTPDPDSLKSAESFAAKFGCTFGFDAFMQNWCFTKPPISN